MKRSVDTCVGAEISEQSVGIYHASNHFYRLGSGLPYFLGTVHLNLTNSIFDGASAQASGIEPVELTFC